MILTSGEGLFAVEGDLDLILNGQFQLAYETQTYQGKKRHRENAEKLIEIILTKECFYWLAFKRSARVGNKPQVWA